MEKGKEPAVKPVAAASIAGVTPAEPPSVCSKCGKDGPCGCAKE